MSVATMRTATAKREPTSSRKGERHLQRVILLCQVAEASPNTGTNMICVRDKLAASTPPP